MEPELKKTAPAHIGSEAFKPQDKDNQRFAIMQDAAQKLCSHLVSTTTDELAGAGKFDRAINKDLEGRMARTFLSVIMGYKDSDGNHLVQYEAGDYLRVFNGRFYEPFSFDAVQNIISIALERLDVGNAYILRSDKPITEHVLKRMRNNQDCKYVPDGNLLCLTNGIYDVQTGELLPPSPRLVPRFVIPLPYEQSDCALWHKVLNEDLDEELHLVLQECLGYVVAGPNLEKLIIFVGGGRNGKSLVLNTIIGILGKQNVSNFSLAQIAESSGQKIPAMRDKIANICTDAGAFLGKADEGTLKAYISGEPIMSKVLYMQPYQTQNYPKSVVAMNALPSTGDLSDGFFRRFLIVPFSRQVPEEKVDIHLSEKLTEERIGILAWILEGATRLWKQGRFSDSQLVRQAQEQYRKDADAVASFLDEKGYIATDDMRMTLADAYREFKGWSLENGYRGMAKSTFSARIRALKIKIAKKSGQQTVFMGNPFAEPAPF